MFDLDRFIADCRAALCQEAPQHTIRETMMRALADPAALLRGLGEPKRAGIQKLFHSADLTVLNVVWAPKMTLLPHDHRMWAVIGIYTGREDNIFWRRVNDRRKIAAAGAKALCEKEVELLGRDVIHSVTNPISRLTGAIHVYTGDFFGVIRSEWDPETLLERPYDVEKNLRLFEEANSAGLGSWNHRWGGGPAALLAMRPIADAAMLQPTNVASGMSRASWYLRVVSLAPSRKRPRISKLMASTSL